ncbi:hypothetical protein BT69DRAFT_1277563, partial [Atractiella rhizophila]
PLDGNVNVRISISPTPSSKATESCWCRSFMRKSYWRLYLDDEIRLEDSFAPRPSKLSILDAFLFCIYSARDAGEEIRVPCLPGLGFASLPPSFETATLMNRNARNFYFFKELDFPASDEYFLLKATGLTLEDAVFFPPGTYKIVLDSSGKEILPSIDSTPKLWLQCQECPSPCSWRFGGKNPDEIFRHVSTCQFRSPQDPLRKLCLLWKGRRSR